MPVPGELIDTDAAPKTRATRMFLSAEWKSLLMLNYQVEPRLLAPFLPWGCELDLFQNRCYVSLVGFQFLNTRVKGRRIPFHINFLEVNLRFYVRQRVDRQWRRGVVFIREIVPRRLITWVANAIYRENYATLPMQCKCSDRDEPVRVEYRWTFRSRLMRIWGESQASWRAPVGIDEGSETEFLTEHYWGYARISPEKTKAYEVRHPKWRIWPLVDSGLEGDAFDLYPEISKIMYGGKPVSALLAEGSPVEVYDGRNLIIEKT